MNTPRVFRFSLRTLLVFLTLACLWLAWQGQRARDQKAAVAAIRAVGGECNYTYQFDRHGRFLDATEPAASKWLRDLVGEDFFVTVCSVAMVTSPAPGGAEYTVRKFADDAVLEYLRLLPKLTSLAMRSDDLTDAGLRTIGM